MSATAQVAGKAFLECFCGAAVFTAALHVLPVPAIRPWDAVRGQKYNALVRGHILLSLALAGRAFAVHSGTPCQSLTLARWPQPRSWDHLLGLPSIAARQQELVGNGSALALFAMRLSWAAAPVGAYFGIENPERPWFWALP